jgi:two-component system, chemotaxis family, chemotaxis protein CheY
VAEASILVVDGEGQIRDTTKLALASAGFRVAIATNGPEAMGKFGNGEDWDLVLLDQGMPGRDGMEILCRMHRTNAGVPILFVTARGTVDLVREVLGSGASGFLLKPINPALLCQVLHDMLRSRRINTLRDS